MIRITRVAPLALGLVAVIGAGCRRQQPATTPTPAVDADSVARADAAARERARQDSIANAQRAEQDRLAAERAAAERRLTDARTALTSAIYFDYDRADITDEGKATLDAKLPLMNANPALRVRVAGHTDARGSDEYNLALGQRRASATKRYLVLQGVPANRIDVISYGEERPAAAGDDDSSYSQNRRAEFEILAGGDNLQLPQQ
jgi:peptidoglycan-associated lipoprotein